MMIGMKKMKKMKRNLTKILIQEEETSYLTVIYVKKFKIDY
jgi:hypothetical protein